MTNLHPRLTGGFTDLTADCCTSMNEVVQFQIKKDKIEPCGHVGLFGEKDMTTSLVCDYVKPKRSRPLIHSQREVKSVGFCYVNIGHAHLVELSRVEELHRLHSERAQGLGYHVM